MSWFIGILVAAILLLGVSVVIFIYEAAPARESDCDEEAIKQYQLEKMQK